MARVIETTVYQYDELSESAQDKARDQYRNHGDIWYDASEYWESGKEFSKIAPIRITGADYDHGQVDIEWTGDDDCRELEGLRAWKWLLNNDWFNWAARNKAGECTMTGAWCDCAFGDGIMEYADKPLQTPSIEQVFYESAQAWAQSARRDLEHAYSDDAVAESIRINEYEFTSEGEWHV